jgi:diguanylate cyclase (GGDEF)-like protein/PAS domain S-box-containing protein
MQASARLQAPEAPQQRHAVRVLLLEDDRVTAEIFAAYLRRIPWAAAELSTARSLAEALALLQQGSFDLIVSDLNLPDSRGAATVARLAAAGQGLIIAVTSDEDPSLQQASLESGAYEFLHKRSLNGAILQRLVRLAVMQSRTLGSVRQGEEELRRFRAAVDESADMIVVIDRATMRYVDVNRTMCQVLGYSREELLAMGPQDLLPVPRAELERSYDELLAHPSVESGIRTEYRCRDGSALPIHSKRRALESGGRRLIVSVARDVRESLAAEQALKESEARFRSLSQLSADVFWEQDADYRFTSFSEKHPRPHMQAWLGKRRSELGYVNMTPADWAAHYADLDARRTFHDLELCRVENGEAVWITVSGEPIFAADGGFRGYRGVGRNITERKRGEALLRLEHAVTRCLAEADNAEAALQAVIRAICEAEGWECGRYFAVDEPAGVLRFSAGWGVALPPVQAFMQRSRQLAYRRGEGLSGSAWASGEPLWATEVAADPRARDKVRAGLAGGAFVFPLAAEGRTLGVLSFSRSGARQPDARLLRTMQVIGSQLALFLQRQAALDAVRESQATHLRHQERIARFGQSALACRDPQELVSDAVQQVLEALAADAAAYLEAGPAGGELVREACGVPLGAEAFAETAPGAYRIPVRSDRGVRGMLCAVSRERGLKPEEVNFLDAVAAVLTAGLRRMDSEERLAFLAQFDPLTGLPNRALLADRFAQMIVQARRHAGQLGVLFVDLDDFKLVNDTLGHAAGDELLKQAAARLRSAVRDGDTVARISGDEFAVVLNELARQEDAALVAQKIIDRLAAPFELRGKEMFVTASVGIAVFPGDGGDAESLLGAADAAMYRAKQHGRNAFQFFTAEINQRTRARAQLGAELRRALERDEFDLAYQPKYDLASGRACGAEALLRWNHPQRGVVSPAEFVPVLEESGLIGAAGEWVLARACRDLKAWAAAGARPLPVAVNLSARQFRASGLEARIGAVLSAAGVSPQLIELEITESQLMHDPDQAIRTMQALRAQGMRIAIDDFGTGYSSLAYLTRFPVAALKVDRSFVAGIERHDGDAAIVRAVIEMARTLGFTVIAEGVERPSQVEFLRQFGCHQAQGFFFARPMPAAAFQELIKSGSEPG